MPNGSDDSDEIKKALLRSLELKRLESLHDLTQKQRLSMEAEITETFGDQIKQDEKVRLTAVPQPQQFQQRPQQQAPKNQEKPKRKSWPEREQTEEESRLADEQEQPPGESDATGPETEGEEGSRDQENKEPGPDGEKKDYSPEELDQWMDENARSASPEDREAFKNLAGKGAPEIGAGAAEGGAAAGAAGAGAVGGAAAVEGGAAAGGAVAATAPFWGTALGIFLLVLVVLGLGFFIFMSMVSYCNQEGIKGMLIRAYSTGTAWTGIVPIDICKKLAIDQGGARSGGGGASGAFGLDIIITSAYRPGSIVAGTGRLSAHSRGEAVDIALRNPAVPIGSSDPRIAQLVQVSEQAGFAGISADVLDEYTNPTEGASGGHIHVEFNLKPDGTSYCDGTKIPPSGPTDLENIVGLVAVDTASTSDPRLRPCMLDKVINIFAAAGAVINTPSTTTSP